MKLLPYENFYIITDLKPDEVQKCMQSELEPPSSFSFKNLFSRPSGAYFSGYARNGIFLFKRIIDYRNSFLPEISGSTEAWLNGSKVHIKMYLQDFVMGFLYLWLGLAVLFGVVIFVQNFSKREFNLETLIPFGMFIFVYLLVMGGFKYESVIAKDKLLDMLNGKIENK